MEGLTQKAQELTKGHDRARPGDQAAMGMEELAVSHFYWEKLLAELRSILLNAEATTQADLESQERRPEH